MKFLSKFSFLLIAILLGFSSCGDEPDGKWAKMKWNNVDNLSKTNNIYVIPEEGGSFTFECKNYTPWIAEVVINTEHQDISSQEDWNWKVYTNDWFEVKITDKKVIFSFDEIKEPMTGRTAEVVMTAGDIFDTFIFQQQKLQ